MDTIIKKSIQIIAKIIAHTLIFLILLIRPLLGPSGICPYTIGCTPYALDQLQNNPLPKALYNIISRLLRCHPFSNRKL